MDKRLSDLELHLFSEGTLYRAYDSLGAQPVPAGAGPGFRFAVWAPNARRVSVVGDFNGWDETRLRLEPAGTSGIWQGWTAEAAEGAFYKYRIETAGGAVRLKSDPYAFAMELRPGTASIIHDTRRFQWTDGKWMADRFQRHQTGAPISIYELHLGSWDRRPDGWFLDYRELAPRLVEYLRPLGFTHVELLPVTEHALDESWGYQTTGYFAPTSRHGQPEDFAWFVDYLHRHGIGVILDWAPAHFPADDHGLAWFDGTALYEHADPRQREHRDWGTHIFNYGRYEVANFLISSALFWLDRYHLDGLRVDAVASMLYLDYSRRPGEWVPNRYGGRENLEAVAFLKRLNETIYRFFPDTCTVAEESTAWPKVSRPTWEGGLGFGYKWNLGWMHDTLAYFRQDPLFRRYHQKKLTFGLIYAFSEHFILPLSHDEVVHGKGSLLGKMPGDDWQKFASLRLLLGYLYTQPGRKLLFMGGEFGQWREWNCRSGLDWNLLQYEPHRKLRDYLADLNRIYRNEPALHQLDSSPEGFRWIDFQDHRQNVIAFRRLGREPGEELLVLGNFAPVLRRGYRVGVPEAGTYREILNSDSEYYGGSNAGNQGGRPSEAVPAHALPHSLRLTLPPLALLVLKRDR